MKEQEIGEFFKEKLSGYQASPPKGMWESIQQDANLQKTNRNRRTRHAFSHIVLPIIGIIAVISTIAVISINSNKQSDNQFVNNKSTQNIATAEKQVETQSLTEKQTSQNIVSVPVILSENEQSATETTEKNFSTPVFANQDAVAENSNEESVTPLISNQLVKKAVVTPIIPTVTHNNIVETPTFTENIVSPAPAPTLKSGKSEVLRFSKDTAVCRNSAVSLFVENAAHVYWSTGSSNSVITIYPEESLQLYASIQTMEKVDTTIYVNIDVFDCELFIPSAFTPNGDGLNDEFLVHAPMDITNYECIIFDKMSRTLFQSKNIHQGWDGTLNGKPLAPGTYFYVITFRDALNEKHVMKGQLILIR